jgi:hypothetical protein
MWNAAFNAAKSARTDANYANRAGDTQPMNIAIYTIGYTNNAGTDQGLLQAIANDKNSPVYSASQPTGLYLVASNPTSLADAFTVVASAILRLAY